MTTARAWSEETEQEIEQARVDRLERERRSRADAEIRARRGRRSWAVRLVLGFVDVTREWMGSPR